MSGITLHDFVKELRINKTFTSKQERFIENLYIYFEDLKVYKIVIALVPSLVQKAKKFGLNEQYTTICTPDIEKTLKIDALSDEDKRLESNVKKGKYICIYNLMTQDCAIYHGEESEKEQRAKIKKRPVYNF